MRVCAFFIKFLIKLFSKSLRGLGQRPKVLTLILTLNLILTGEIMKTKNWLESFFHAVNGIRSTARRERNFRIHIVAAVLAVGACVVFRVEFIYFVMVGFSVFFVMAMELVNTAVEALVDMYCRGKPHPLAKLAKDAAAGAVLLASVMALIVGILVTISVIGRWL